MAITLDGRKIIVDTGKMHRVQYDPKQATTAANGVERRCPAHWQRDRSRNSGRYPPDDSANSLGV